MVSDKDKLISCKGGLVWEANISHNEIKEECPNYNNGACTLEFFGGSPKSLTPCKIYEEIIGFATAVGSAADRADKEAS